MTSHDLKTLIEMESVKRGCSTATLCKKAVGNNRLHRTLVGGGSCTLDVAQRFLNYLEKFPVAESAAA